ncbi:DUF6492 family protein [Congregibacter sp.]|uniref:DUF6492 family protein n=1 Tax=Congregibacter sp. TaxID=2744308 RepID=UPI003F6C403C
MHDAQRDFRDIGMVTCTYEPDFDSCRILCRSVDRWVSGDITHWLVVPARDVALFRQLSNGRRSVIAVEDVVPGYFRQLPRSNRWWLNDRSHPVRGSMMQQLTKLSANFATCAEVIVFADSKVEFMRPFSREDVAKDGFLRLNRIVGARRSMHRSKSHHNASKLVGSGQHNPNHDFTGPLISWRRGHLEGLQRHVEERAGYPWHQCIMRSPKMSEYALYAAYIEAIIGIENSGHFYCDDSMSRFFVPRTTTNRFAPESDSLQSPAAMA